MNDVLIRQCISTDLERRLQVVPADVHDWENREKFEGDGLGLHASQLRALSTMMDELFNKQLEQMSLLKSSADPLQFAESYQDLLEQVSGSQDVWKIFGSILEQRRSAHVKRLTDLADLIAWSCYDTCMRNARKWGAVKQDEYREPPLIYLESSLTPSTASRGEQIGLLSTSLRYYRDLVLPVPIVLYPRDQAESVWMMCAIAHEVGHNLDHDLDTRPGVRLTDEYRQKLIGLVPNECRPQWRRWMNEMFADAVAVVLCQAGYAISMSFWAVALAPAKGFQELDTTAEHPPLYLRLLLLAEMLRATGVQLLMNHGDRLWTLWKGLHRPAWQEEYENEAPKVAKLLLNEKITALKDHALMDLADDPHFAYQRSEQLAYHLLDSGAAPTIKDDSYPFQLIPAAAALAINSLSEFDQASLNGIHQRALDYFANIPVSKFLDANAARQNYIRDLSKKLDFSRRVKDERDQ